jgi:phytoene dehydrogenase-like protein
MISIWGGPSTPGTGYVYGHHSVGEFDGHLGQFGFARGGMGSITRALAAGLGHHGGDIRLRAPVAEIRTVDGRAAGVTLASGEEIDAEVVISNADPKRSLLQLLAPGALDPTLEQSVRTIDTRGSMARVHLLIDQLPAYIGFDSDEGPQHRGHQMLGASVENFEKAWEAERRGELPDEYVIEAVIQSTHDPTVAPAGKHTLTLGVQQLPGELASGTWDSRKESFTDQVLDNLYQYAPNLRDHILERVVITPQDLEREYGLTGGNIFHGAMFLDQLFGARPLPELASYRTPVAGYYLCGSGTHPGGGVTGAPGHNAAQIVLSDLGAASKPSAAHRPNGRQKGLVERLMDTEAGRRAGYALARQPALRPITKRASRRKGE